MSAESWKTVAIALGRRMELHAFCGDHSPPEDDCPFCRDVVAYNRYKTFATRHGVTIIDDPYAGQQSVSIYDLPMNPRIGPAGGSNNEA